MRSIAGELPQRARHGRSHQGGPLERRANGACLSAHEPLSERARLSLKRWLGSMDPCRMVLGARGGKLWFALRQANAGELR